MLATTTMSGACKLPGPKSCKMCVWHVICGKPVNYVNNEWFYYINTDIQFHTNIFSFIKHFKQIYMAELKLTEILS